MATHNPSLPQNDGPLEQHRRRAELAKKQAAYVYDHGTRVAPLGVARAVPDGEGFAPILAGSVVLVVLDLLANLLAKGSKIFGPGGVAAAEKEILVDARDAFFSLRNSHQQLTNLITELHIEPMGPPPALSIAGVVSFFEKVEGRVEKVVEGLVSGTSTLAKIDPAERVWQILKDILEN